MKLTATLRIVLLIAAAGMIFGAIALAFLGSSFAFSIVFSNGLTLLIFTGVAMACSIVRDRGIQPRRMLSGVVAAMFVVACSVVMVIATRWGPPPTALAYVAYLAAVWATLMAITGLLALPAPRAGWWQVLRRVTVSGLYSVAGLIMLGALLHPDVSPLWTLLGFDLEYRAADTLERLGFGLVLLTGAMIAITFLTMWLTPPLVHRGAVLPLWLRCPRCSNEHDRHTGDGRCEQCGLRITVLVQ